MTNVCNMLIAFANSLGQFAVRSNAESMSQEILS